MKLPAFLKFLAPLFRDEFLEAQRLKGWLRIETRKNGVVVDVPYDGPNFIVDLGLTSARDVLIGTNGAGFSGSLFRMAIGDGGCPAGQLFSPKQPDGTWPAKTALFHEVLRQDISAFSKPTSSSMRFVGSFDSTVVDPTSYSLSERVINEAALIIGDGVLTVGGDKKQINKVPPDTVDPDEKLFSMRTFKSTPFSYTEDVTITCTWTITVVR